MIKLKNIEPAEVEKFCRGIYGKVDLQDKQKLNKAIWYFFRNSSDVLSFLDQTDTLLKIMCLDYQNLKILKDEIDNRYSFFHKIMSWQFKTRITREGKILPITVKEYLIDLYGKIDNKKFVKLTNVTVCPYCNRNFVSVTDKINNSQLDHFFPKSHNGAGKRSYPIFALSFYNLVPSCYGCNHKKGDGLFEVSPYDEEYHSQDLLSFSWKPKPLQTSPWFDASSIEVTMTIPAGSIYKSDFEKLDLQEQYQLHTDYVQELLWKKQIYSKSYREKMLEEFKSLGLVERDFDRVITGVYTDERDHGKRPLSKLVTDISREIGLLREKRE